MQSEVILNAIDGGAANKNVKVMNGVVVSGVGVRITDRDAAGNDWICCIDDCCWGADWDAGWNVDCGAVKTAERDAETVADDVKFSDGDVVESLEISKCVVENAVESWEIFENSETGVDGLEISERVDGNE